MASGRIVVIGASAGGVRALQALAAQLPAGFDAPLLVVQHIGNYASILPLLLGRSGPLPASHAQDGERVAAGRIHVAPPDHHMLLEGDVIRLSRGPKENHTRPAIDPLFRSAAISRGPAVIGVLLTGRLDDGTAGLQAIKECGGTVVVQDPEDAEMPSMPASALRYVEVDHRLPLAAMGHVLAALVAQPARAAAPPRPQHVHESDITLGKGDFMEHLEAIGKPSTFVCPECEGALWEINGSEPRRFRCHTGHGFTLRALYAAQSEGTDGALWAALRALQEKEMLLKSLAESHREAHEPAEAARLDEEARKIASHTAALRGLVERVPAPRE